MLRIGGVAALLLLGSQAVSASTSRQPSGHLATDAGTWRHGVTHTQWHRPPVRPSSHRTVTDRNRDQDHRPPDQQRPSHLGVVFERHQ